MPTNIITNRDALFIDIDDTITRSRYANTDEQQNTFLDFTLLYSMLEFAQKHHGKDRNESEQLLRNVAETIRWWHWTDFIRALDLDPHAFWEYAYEKELEYLEPIAADLPRLFEKLHNAGYRMFITSNNPSSGMLLKLRIAGLGEIWGSKYFLQYLSPCDLHFMKWEKEFWSRALAHTGLNPDHVVVIGDLWRDDVVMPFEAGIKKRIHLDITRSESPDYEQGVWKVNSWNQIVNLLTVQQQPVSV